MRAGVEHLPHVRGLHFVDNNDSLRHLGRAHHPVAVRGIVEGPPLPAFHPTQARLAQCDSVAASTSWPYVRISAPGAVTFVKRQGAP